MIVDSSLENADWVKQSWDVRVPGVHSLVGTVSELLEALLVVDASRVEQKRAVRRFMELPSSEQMPPSLRRECRRFVR